MTFDVFLTMIHLQHIYIYSNFLPFPFLLSMCHQRPFLHYYFIDLTEYYLLTFTSISSLDLMICQGSSYFDLHLPFLLRSYFPNSGIFFQKSNFWVFSQSIKRAIYNRTNTMFTLNDEPACEACFWWDRTTRFTITPVTRNVITGTIHSSWTPGLKSIKSYQLVYLRLCHLVCE